MDGNAAAPEALDFGAGRHYEIAAGARIEKLDDDAMVFNPFSWETHLLNPAASVVLERVACGSCAEEGVVEVLTEVLDETERPRAAEHAQQLLNELVNLHLLVERTAEPDAGG